MFFRLCFRLIYDAVPLLANMERFSILEDIVAKYATVYLTDYLLLTVYLNFSSVLYFYMLLL